MLQGGFGYVFKKQVRVGVKEGGGPPPGFRWSVKYLSVVGDEALKFLAPSEYEHVLDQVRALACEEAPTRPKTVSVKSIRDFCELLIKGGPLRKKNVRLFFFIARERCIVLLGCRIKQNNAPLPSATLKLMSARKRRYLAGG